MIEEPIIDQSAYKNSQIFCTYCQAEGKPDKVCWIPYPQYNKHRDGHAEAIAEIAHSLINDKDIEARIILILERSSSARAKPAELQALYFRAYPFLGKYRIIYDAQTGVVEFPKFDSYDDSQGFVTSLSNIARIDRHVRSMVRPDLNASPRAMKKQILAITSKHDWYTKSHSYGGEE